MTPDPRQSDRRTHDAAVINDHRQSPRRISPAIGEHAIQENAQLREINRALVTALKDFVDYVSPGDDVPLAAMLDEARATLAKATQS